MSSAFRDPSPPEARGDTVEAWCRRLVGTVHLAEKLDPGAPPGCWDPSPVASRIAAPGRPPELRPVPRAPRTPAPAAWADPAVRARVVHTLLHHEVQAAELFAWALLAFPATPRAFRAGLLRLCLEELAHARLYAGHLERLGSRVGAFPVRDWFWERVATCDDAGAFVALQGLGLEGANLEHSARFAERFRAAGDERGAAILERVERDEIGHVRFAAHWFEVLTGGPLEYRRWADRLPRPLTPAVLRGRPLNRAARRAAGLDDDFLARLDREPDTTVRPRR